jgi:hypothetical protein
MKVHRIPGKNSPIDLISVMYGRKHCIKPAKKLKINQETLQRFSLGEDDSIIPGK